jgi:hypothetical protein
VELPRSMRGASRFAKQNTNRHLFVIREPSRAVYRHELTSAARQCIAVMVRALVGSVQRGRQEVLNNDGLLTKEARLSFTRIDSNQYPIEKVDCLFDFCLRFSITKIGKMPQSRKVKNQKRFRLRLSRNPPKLTQYRRVKNILSPQNGATNDQFAVYCSKQRSTGCYFCASPPFYLDRNMKTQENYHLLE